MLKFKIKKIRFYSESNKVEVKVILNEGGMELLYKLHFFWSEKHSRYLFGNYSLSNQHKDTDNSSDGIVWTNHNSLINHLPDNVYYIAGYALREIEVRKNITI